jgi:hypothetical protein
VASELSGGDAGTRVPGTGRSLDMLIAEKVMGWTPGVYGGVGKYRDERGYQRGEAGWLTGWHWDPSKNVAQAFDVLTQLRALGWEMTFGVTRGASSGWWIVGSHDAVPAAQESDAETFPLAVVRFAIACVDAAAPSTGAPDHE